MTPWKIEEVREKTILSILGIVLLYATAVAISLGISAASHATGQEPVEYRPVPPYIPPTPNAGLDPIGITLNKQRIRIYELEQSLLRLEQLTIRQHWQIHQLQQYVFYGRPFYRPGQAAGALELDPFEFRSGVEPAVRGVAPLKLDAPMQDYLKQLLKKPAVNPVGEQFDIDNLPSIGATPGEINEE